MKKVVVTAALGLITTGIFAQNPKEKLPESASSFLKDHFPKVAITEIKENNNWRIWEDEKFEVKLANGIEVDFNEKGNAIEIESKSHTDIPLEALPVEIGGYLKENYSEVIVLGWEKDSKNQEVELEDGTEIEFDSDGNFRKFD